VRGPTVRDDLSPFVRRVLEVVAATRTGDVLTYGEVASEAGRPAAARAVGSALARHGSQVAWWRVVSASGRLVPGREAEHRGRLEAEGVRCDGSRIVRMSAERTHGLGRDAESRY
jgi:methylated-DNA-protein-cysteine methyltransferase related protein